MIAAQPLERAGTGAVCIVVVVGSRGPQAEALVSSLDELHPSWPKLPVWAGDPQLRPAPVCGHRWAEPVVGELDLVRVDDDARPWLVGLTAARDLLESRDGRVLVLVAGSIAVLDSLDELAAAGDTDELTLIPRMLVPPLDDGLFPGIDELANSGSFSTAVAAFGPGTSDAVGWLLDHLLSPHPPQLRRLIDLAARAYATHICRRDEIGASAWRWPDGVPTLIEAPNYRSTTPWLIDPTLSGPPRVSLADSTRRASLDRAAGQLGGGLEPLRLPGGLSVDKVIRDVLRSDPDAPTRPWSRAREFRTWLDRRYWSSLFASRPDLVSHFSEVAGGDHSRFRVWAEGAAWRGEAPLLIDPAPITDGDVVVRRTGRRTDGVNIVGYLRHQSGIGSVGRRMVDLMRRGGVAHTTIAYDRAENPRLDPAPVCDQRIEFSTSIAFVNGDQFACLHRDLPDLFTQGDRVIGYWFWELSTLQGGPPVDASHLDEIWTATHFTAEAFGELESVPVRVVPLPIAEPKPSPDGPPQLPLSVDPDGRFVFGVVLDHLSVTARKNPLGAMQAFKTAFAPNEGPLLVVKTLNGRRLWREHERLLAATEGRDDILVWDVHLPIADHLAFVASLDCLVSLHRSEGLGLHLAEAMWMGVPVIATRYSGNMDFMDDSCAALIDATVVPVGDNGGWAYPPTAQWAEPDLDLAAATMRRMVSDPAFAAGLAYAGRERMLAQPDDREFVAEVTRLLGLTGGAT